MRTYEAHLAGWADREGQFVLIKGSDILGFYPGYDELRLPPVTTGSAMALSWSSRSSSTNRSISLGRVEPDALRFTVMIGSDGPTTDV